MDCLQEGDPRAFGRCHKSIRRIHREKAKHTGIQVLTHGPRDVKERTKSILKKVVVGLSAAGLATGAVLSAAVSIIAPNPGTVIAAGTLLHMTISAATISAGATVTSSASAFFSETVVDPRDLAAMVIAGEVTAEELEELERALKGFTTQRGKCSKCEGKADKEPCIYFWTCCKKDFPRDEKSLSAFYDGCTAVCTSCNRILFEDDKTQRSSRKAKKSGDKTQVSGHKIEVPGCLNQCSGCGAVEDEEGFSNNGCGTASHRLE